MKKSTKIWLVLASFLTIIGLTMFAFAMTKYNWDFKKLSTEKYKTTTHQISEDFENISINTDTVDIIFVLSNDKECKIECFESEKSSHIVTAKDNTLTIENANNQHWYDNIGINFNSPKITVYLPKTEYVSLSIKEHTGDILLPKDFKFYSADILTSTGDIEFLATVLNQVKIDTDTGDISVKDSKAKALDISTSTGDVTLSNVIARDKFNIETDTGDVKFERSDADEIFVETDTGSVKGSLLTEKIFITSTDTGRVDVPKTISGGKCEITTDTGDIKITID